jgi:hypothetical protein
LHGGAASPVFLFETGGFPKTSVFGKATLIYKEKAGF